LSNNDLEFHVYDGREFFNAPVPRISRGAGVTDPAVVKQTKRVAFYIPTFRP